jgi:hypothetical protein
MITRHLGVCQMYQNNDHLTFIFRLYSAVAVVSNNLSGARYMRTPTNQQQVTAYAYS